MVTLLVHYTYTVSATIGRNPVLFMLIWLALIIILERRLSAYQLESDGSRPRRRLTGFFFGAINHALLCPLLTSPLLIWAASIHLWNWPTSIPSWFTVSLTVVALDLAGYWYHRVAHYNQFLWRFHQIHHLDEEMDATTGLRVHFGEHLIQTAIAAVVVAAFDLPVAGVVTHALASYTFAVFHHSNIRIPAWLERVLAPAIITPEFHYPHHHARRSDTDSNYGFIFVWWDRLFGTHNTRRRERNWRMGLEYSPDLDCLNLLQEPFRRTPLWRRRRTSRKTVKTSAEFVFDKIIDAADAESVRTTIGGR
jgi:sterol desaturase/sphingolipid hydroxylase (fatty acid hydroxylase superfamily)